MSDSSDDEYIFSIPVNRKRKNLNRNSYRERTLDNSESNDSDNFVALSSETEEINSGSVDSNISIESSSIFESDNNFTDQMYTDSENEFEDVSLFQNSSTKIDEFLLALYAIKLKHKVNDSTIEDFLFLIKSILPKSNKCPKTVSCFKKFSHGNSNFHIYCSICNLIKKTDTIENYKLLKEECCEKEVKTFVTFNIKEQLQTILTPAAINQIRNNVNNAYEEKTEINNAMDGVIYKKFLKNKEKSNLVVSFNINTDGAPLVKSRSYSLWPLIGTITELNASTRESFNNIVIFGKIIMLYLT